MTQGTSPAIQMLKPILARAAGPVVRWAREACGYGQVEFAIRTTLSQPHLSRIENSRVYPNLPILFLAASAAGVSAAQLVEQIEQDPALRAALAQILHGAKSRAPP
jgi:transcriptional regulator with XRE-family HTH domain